MPQVPYKPAPDVSPTMRGTPQFQVQTPPAAFGGAVAAALQHIGQTGEQVGGELFSRAVAMQNLQNETEAMQGDTKFSKGSAELYEGFASLRGQDAMNAQGKFNDDLEKLRADIRGTLSNPAAQRMYDAQTHSTVGRSIFSAARHAATEQREWVKGEADSSIASLKNQVYNHSSDNDLFEKNLQDIYDKTDLKSTLEGFGPAKQQMQKEKETADLWAHRIVGEANTDPRSAYKMFNYAHDKLGPMADKVEKTVQDRMRTIDSRIMVGEVMNEVRQRDAEGKPQPTYQSMEDALTKKAEKQGGNIPLYVDYVRDRFRHEMRNYQTDRKMDEVDTMQGVKQAIVQYQPKSLEAFKATPNGQALYGKMKPGDQINLPGMISRYHDKVFQETNQATMHLLKGMAEEEPIEFLAIDPTKYELAKGDVDKIYDLQQAKRKDMNASPQLQAAYKSIERNLPLDFGSTANKESRQQFKGALMEAMILETQRTGKKPDQAKMNEISKNLLKTFTTPAPGYWEVVRNLPFMGDDRYQFYKAPLAENVKQKIVEDWKDSRGGEEPTEDQIRNAYVRMLYLKEFPGKASTKQPAQALKGSPGVPFQGQ